ASRTLATATRSRKDDALLHIAESIEASAARIVEANKRDLERGRENGTSSALLDRLELDDERIAGLADSLRELAALPDPVGAFVRGQTLANGLRMRQIRVPMGVVGAIYEARPNVTVDIAGIALKSGNAVLLRGGSAAAESNR
ncbi:gamma-glutamyl-phosphate reductase, partial [Rhizobium leguminosarum]|nr:gamma-glutamyl-phosphate reductase [Rhizobium ruizarguesonis]